MEASTHNQTLELGLESLEVTDVPLDHRIPNSRSEVGPEFLRRAGSTVAEGIDYIESRGVVPSEPVGDRVGELELLRSKGASGDLIVVIWVTPSTEPARRVIVEDGRVGEVRAGI